MAFNINAFDNVTSGSSLGPRIWSYGSATDTLAEIAASGYFDAVKFRIEDKDLVYVSGSDGAQFVKLSSQGGEEPVTTEVWIPSSGGGGGGSVVLPTVAGSFAGFTDTAGTISSGPADLTNDGSIFATANVIADGSLVSGAIITAVNGITSGSSGGGSQGKFTAYPTSVSSGYFEVNALDSANGNYSSTLYNNPSISASKTYLLPNPTTNNEVYIAAYDGALSQTPGNVAVFGSNAGILVDGGPPGGGGFTWNNVSGTTQSATVGNGYITSNAAQTTVTLPNTAAVGSVVSVQGKGAGGFRLVAGTGQTIQVGQVATTTAGSVTSAANFDSISVVCITANTTWAVTNVLSSGVTTA